MNLLSAKTQWEPRRTSPLHIQTHREPETSTSSSSPASADTGYGGWKQASQGHAKDVFPREHRLYVKLALTEALPAAEHRITMASDISHTSWNSLAGMLTKDLVFTTPEARSS